MTKYLINATGYVELKPIKLKLVPGHVMNGEGHPHAHGFISHFGGINMHILSGKSPMVFGCGRFNVSLHHSNSLCSMVSSMMSGSYIDEPLGFVVEAAITIIKELRRTLWSNPHTDLFNPPIERELSNACGYCHKMSGFDTYRLNTGNRYLTPLICRRCKNEFIKLVKKHGRPINPYKIYADGTLAWADHCDPQYAENAKYVEGLIYEAMEPERAYHCFINGGPPAPVNRWAGEYTPLEERMLREGYSYGSIQKD